MKKKGVSPGQDAGVEVSKDNVEKCPTQFFNALTFHIWLTKIFKKDSN